MTSHHLTWGYVMFNGFPMVFLTNEFTKKAEITILSARESTRPGLQAGALWVERKAYIRGSVARDSHPGL